MGTCISASITLQFFMHITLSRCFFSYINFLLININQQSETPTPNPATNNHSAAARFFASYKDAERSPISTTVTTDFTRACDTSISHDVADSSVGAIVGGRLLLNLHTKEQQQQQNQESMPRAQSLMSVSSRSANKGKIKRSHSTGNFPKRQAIDHFVNGTLDHCSSGKDTHSLHEHLNPRTGFQRDIHNQQPMNINNMDHIYPNVIVQSSKNQHSDEDEESLHANGENCVAYSQTSQLYGNSSKHHVDTSGARIIEVNIEDGSIGSVDGSAELQVSPPDRSPKFSLKHQSQSADASLEFISQIRYGSSGDDYLSLKRDKLQLYSQMLEEWKKRARQRYRLAKLAAQKEQDEVYEQRMREKYGYQRSKVRSGLCGHHRQKNGAPYPLRRTKTVDVDYINSFDDLSTRRAKFSGKPGRMFTSMEDLETHHHTLSGRFYRGQMNEIDDGLCFTECDCLDCAVGLSTSFNSDVSSVGKSAATSQEGPFYSSASYKSEKPWRERVRFNSRSVSTTSDPLRRHSGRNQKRGTSFHRKGSLRNLNSRQYRQRRSRHGSGHAKTTRTLHINNAPSSSTDSDLGRRVIQTKTFNTNTKPLPNRPASTLRQLQEPVTFKLMPTKNEYTDSPRSPPGIRITGPNHSQDDVFHAIFSQVVESDDLNSAEEEDDPYILQSKQSAKFNILNYDPSFNDPISQEKNEIKLINGDGNKNLNDECKMQNSGAEIDTVNNSNVYAASPLQPGKHIERDARTTSIKSYNRNNVITMRTIDIFEGKALKNSSVGSTSHAKSVSNCGTPNTCNVILYDSSASFDNTGTPPVVKTKFILTKKHSSLDLINPHSLQPDQGPLRNASSMQELRNQASAFVEETNSFKKENSNPSTPSKAWAMTETITKSCEGASNIAITTHTPVKHLEPLIVNGFNVGPEARLPLHKQHMKSALFGIHSNLVQADNIHSLPKTPTSSVDDAHTLVRAPESRAGLSVTESDQSSGSSRSCESTLITGTQNSKREQRGKVKDSAYQTKQSSMDFETSLESRLRRRVQLPKEEDRKVTQRLHQAAVKLLVMQQRLRRARQHLSKDSAVHTISEDDPNLDDIIVVSPKTRTFKPGVLYPATVLKEGETYPEFYPTIYGRIVEEPDPSIEYEV
ncbi:hypothetical protein PoB_005938900 [Plakobranchus ocellatus]|uniref:PEHE domain-containing protein n=1 Tax=Plakobranchus ocellatus TaxID=259542 RepID=A0AAV4CJ92_9GAST|nr:hypothetical protein PoB_005938900 [Plakobranchus ocellatus]